MAREYARYSFDSLSGVGRDFVKRVFCCIAAWEMLVTNTALRHASILGLGQDAKDNILCVSVRGVLWKLPALFRDRLPRHFKQVIPGDLGRKGPWIFERAAGVGVLGFDRSATALAKATRVQLARVCGGETPPEVLDKIEFYTADNAADETAACQLLKQTCKHLVYENPDTTHSIMLATKQGCRGDPEIEKVQQVFLTSKRPYKSVASILRHSTRCRTAFKEEQIDATMVTLSHLGWAPQRHDSQSHALGCSALTIEAILCFMGREVDAKSTYADSSRYNLEVLQLSCRLVLSAMLADLTTEHQTACRHSDVSDPDPTQVSRSLALFKTRALFLFRDGNIMLSTGTFTRQMLDLLGPGFALLAGNRSYVYALPDPAAPEYFEPLERMRAVLGNVLLCLEAALPPTSWQRSFSAFRLPAPTAPAAREATRGQLRRIVQQAGASETAAADAVRELDTLLPQAERHNREDHLDVVASWALASRDRPEALLARAVVDKLLGCFHSSSNIERALKVVSRRLEASKGGLQAEGLSDYFMCDMYAPSSGDLGSAAARPRKSYCASIRQAYTAQFGNPRVYAKQKKPRRDAGTARSTTERDAQGLPTTYAQFRRARECGIQKLEATPASELAEKRRRVGIPADTGKYVTDVTRELRARAAARGATKALRFVAPDAAAAAAVAKAKAKAAPKARPKPKIRKLSHARGGETPPPGETPAPGGETGDKICIYLPPRSPHRELLVRRGVRLCNTRWQLVRFVLEAPLHRGRAISVTERLVDQAQARDSTLIFAQVLGTFATTTRWLATAIRQNSAPRGWAYGGIVAKKVRLGASPLLAARLPEFVDLLRALGDHGGSAVSFVDAFEEALVAFTAVCGEGGLRSKPWMKVCWLCADAAESAAIVAARNLAEPRSRFVLPFADYLRAASPASRGRGCPGQWTF